MKVTATEKRLVKLYRQADSDTKKQALNVLRGKDVTSEEILENLLEGVAGLITK